VSDYGSWLQQSHIPKLWIHGDSGAVESESMRAFCRTLPNQTELTVSGVHFIQEDSPEEIGKAVVGFVRRIRS
jgi:haloalkane dehalogenase